LAVTWGHQPATPCEAGAVGYVDGKLVDSGFWDELCAVVVDTISPSYRGATVENLSLVISIASRYDSMWVEVNNQPGGLTVVVTTS
jgi:hypothetical protein